MMPQNLPRHCSSNPDFLQKDFYNKVSVYEWQQQHALNQCPGSFGAYRVSQDPCDSKSNRLHVDIFRFCFHSFEVHSIDSSNMIGKFPEIFTPTL